TDLQHLAAVLAPAQAARTQQRYAEQRGGRARRVAGKLRGRPLFDDAARLLLTLVYQRQICSMTVLADLLEVTDTCIGSLVHETSEVLEDHAHNPGIASVRFATAHNLLAFLDQDLRPAQTATIHTLSAPTLTGMSRQEPHQLTQRLTPRQAGHAHTPGPPPPPPPPAPPGHDPQGPAPAPPAPHAPPGRPRRAARPPATRRPPPTRHPRRRLSPEDQQQRTRPADRLAPSA